MSEQERENVQPEAPQEQPAETAPQTQTPAAAGPEAGDGEGAGDRPPAARTDRPPQRGARGPRGRPERGGGGRRFGRRKVCMFCVDKVKSIDYKEPARFRRFISDRGRIEPRRKTGNCAKHQRWLSLALKRARHLALLPYTPEHIRETGVFAPRR